MKRFLLILLLIIVSCDKSFKAPEPNKLIDQPMMEEILYDINLLKAAKSKSYKILKDNNVQADIYIYEKYKIDSVTLRQNIEYYATFSFKKAKEIEERVKLRFDTEKNRIEKVIQDSLQKNKINDSVLHHKKKEFKDKQDINILDSEGLIVSNDFKKWILVHSFFEKEKSDVKEVRDSIVKLIANTDNNQHRVDMPTSLLEGKYEFSIYAKKNEMDFIRLRIGLEGYPVIFDLSEGVILGTQEGVVSKIEIQDSGWYKCIIRCAVDNVSVVRVNIFDTNAVSHYPGNNINGVYLKEPKLKKIKKL